MEKAKCCDCGFNDGSGGMTVQSGTADWVGENNPQEVYRQMREVHMDRARDEFKNPNWEKVVVTSFSIVSIPQYEVKPSC